MAGATIEWCTTASVIDGRGVRAHLPACLRTSYADPLAVTLELDVSGTPVTWVFARSLLVEGSLRVSGDGMVRVWPSVGPTGDPRVTILLAGEGERAEVSLPGEAVANFLESSGYLCDDASVASMVDAALARLLSL